MGLGDRVDFQGMSDRDILIAVATRQELLSADFLKFNETQGECNVAVEFRVRELEIKGSKVSQDLATTVTLMDKRVSKVEQSCNTAAAILKSKDTMLDSIYAKISIIIAAMLGAAAFVIDLIWRLRG